MPTNFDDCLFGQTINKHPGSNKELHSLHERDRLMESVLSSMDWKPCRRDDVELHLCESMPNRHLGLKDPFVVGDNIFFLKPGGHPKTKAFGAREWVNVDCSHVVDEKRKCHEANPPP